MTPQLARFALAWIAATSFTACDSSEPATPAADQLNVLLITLDTTRADRMGCYGHAVAQTPAIDSLARDGVRFANAYSQVPLTLPSHASILTGKYPAETGLRVNARGRLTDATPSMARLFQDKGYRTGGFTSIIVLHAFYGLDQGFDVYTNPIGDDEFHSSSRGSVARRGGETCDEALAWLKESDDKPFFAWVHFFDAHEPLNPPAPFDKQLEDPYDGEIAYVDSQVARLLDWLDESGLRDRTLVVLTADHGESLGEHGEDEHGLFIYSATTRVPLLLSSPAKLPAGVVVEQPASLVALLPTVLEIMEWHSDVALSEASLVSAWSDPDWRAPLVYCESEYPRLGYGWSAIQSVVTEDWMFIESPIRELYDRKGDPNERVNVIEQNQDVATSLRTRLLERKDGMRVLAHEATTRDGDVAAALEGIGYVQTASPELVPDDGRDPKEMAPVANDFMHALMLVRNDRRSDAVTILERLVVESPESDAIHGVLGKLYHERGQFAESVRELKLSARTDPDNAENLFSMGACLLGLNDMEGASAAFIRTLEVDPTFGQAHSRLGVLAANRGDFVKAREHFEAFVRVEPRSTSALCNLASLQLQQRDCPSAVTQFQRAIGLDPECVQAHAGLWQTVRVGCFTRQQAIRELRDCMAKHPNNDQLASRLAWAIITDRKVTPAGGLEALELASRLVKSSPEDWFGQDALAVACAANGDFPRAVDAAQRAVLLSRTSQPGVTAQLEQRLRSFQQGQRYFE